LSINRNLSLIKEGIDFDTFFNCNLQINSQGKALAKKIFNAINTLNSKYINWNEYMKGILTLRNKDLNDKLDLFLNIIDEDGNGNLSFEEVYSLSLESLSRNLQKNETE
jgi:Ca2+-binding EF-hand superfamily protein